MFLIDKEANRINQLDRKTFSQLGLKERANLQEWLAHNPSALGEDLLIIQKEFSGFYDTAERLDLLALDKDGNIVIIENKLDDTGRDVTWQALKYASYCSTLDQLNIVDIFQQYLGDNISATQKIEDFIGKPFVEITFNRKQRILLVAANFRKEVTSTVYWLISKYGMQIQCFKATPFAHNDQLFLTIDQIIPTKDTEEFIIKMAQKANEDLAKEEGIQNRHQVRRAFWQRLLPTMKGMGPIFQSNNPTKDNTLYAGGTNMTYISYILTITETYCRVSLKQGRESAEENKLVFDELYKFKNEIELKFGSKLDWERSNDTIQSMISYKLTGVNVFLEEDWPKMIDFLSQNIFKLELALRDYLPEVRKKLLEHLSAKSAAETEMSEE